MYNNWNFNAAGTALENATHKLDAPDDQHLYTFIRHAPASTAARQVAYGYMWWVLEEPSDSQLHGAYMAWGLHGQYLLVTPKLDMVIVHQR